MVPRGAGPHRPLPRFFPRASRGRQGSAFVHRPPRIPALTPIRLLVAGALLPLAACGNARAAQADAPARGQTAAAPAAWSAPRALPASLLSFSRAHPRLESAASGAGGSVHAVLVEDEDRDRRGDQVLYTRFDGAAWTEPERLDAGPGLS